MIGGVGMRGVGMRRRPMGVLSKRSTLLVQVAQFMNQN